MSGEVLTSIVVTMSVLLAKVSDVLMSKDVEFIANVLLEYQTPICTCEVQKTIMLRFNNKEDTVRSTFMSKSALKELNHIK